jgi:hypothetical protein
VSTTTFGWTTPESIQTALSTDLNSLANSTSDTTGFSALSAEIDPTVSGNILQYIDLELVLAAQGSARSAGASIEVWIAYKLDGTNYPDTANAAFAHGLLTAFGLDAATTARRLERTNIPLAPFPFKVYARNRTGQALASTGNTLKYRLHGEKGVTA